MHYEHTTKAIVGLIMGILILVDLSLETFAGVQWMPSSNIFSHILVAFHSLFIFRPIIGLVLIAFGIIGIKRELWVRSLEHQARG